MKTLLEPYDELEIVGYALNSEEAMRKVDELRPDIIIMDINLPEVSGIEITEMISEQFPLSKVIYYTSHVDEELITSSDNCSSDGCRIGRMLARRKRPEIEVRAIINCRPAVLIRNADPALRA